MRGAPTRKLHYDTARLIAHSACQVPVKLPSLQQQHGFSLAAAAGVTAAASALSSPQNSATLPPIAATPFSTHNPSTMPGLIYSFVARERSVLAEYSALAGNFRTVALECLQNSAITDDKFTVTADAYTFNYLVHSGYSE